MEPPTQTKDYFESLQHLPRDTFAQVEGEDFFGLSFFDIEAGRLRSNGYPDQSIELGPLKAMSLGVGVGLRHCGGIIPALGKALRVFNREGWKGVSRRLVSAGRSTSFARDDYAEWIRRYDTITDDKRAEKLACINTFAHRPLISVLLPLNLPDPQRLAGAINSVRNQIYPNWELCIVGYARTNPEVLTTLDTYAKRDDRIKVVLLGDSSEESKAWNCTLAMAAGEWSTFLCEDDLLSEGALYWVVEAINQNPEFKLIYSDEDRIDDSGKRFAPYFKCDWNVDLFYSQNLISHLSFFCTPLLREIGGMYPDFEACRDLDLALRYIERLNQNEILHIPRVLYHVRADEQKATDTPAAEPFASPSGISALNAHFQRKSIAASAEFIGCGYRIRYALPENPPLVSIIIPTRDKLPLLRKCINSILEKTNYPNFEILIIDNGSESRATLRYLKRLASDSRIKVLRDDRPFNFSALNNEGVKRSRGEIVALLNNDVQVINPDWLTEMVSHALRPGVGAVGAKLLYPNGSLQHGGVILGIRGLVGHSHKHLPPNQQGYFSRASLVQTVSAVTAACMVIRKEIYQKVGGLDEINLKVAYNDVDFCLRIREEGYRNIWTPFAELYHHESSTRGYEDTPEKRARFAGEAAYLQKKWGARLLDDPNYSRNLTLDFWDFSLAWPPRKHTTFNTTNGILHQESQATENDPRENSHPDIGNAVGPSARE